MYVTLIWKIESELSMFSYSVFKKYSIYITYIIYRRSTRWVLQTKGNFSITKILYLQYQANTDSDVQSG